MQLEIRKTQAAILVNLGQKLIVDEITLPEVLEAGQVLVKVLYSGICGSQIGEINGVKGYDKFLPHLLGHEGVAEVLQVGPGVRFIKPGQRVVMHWMKGQGIDAIPPVYKWNKERLNAGYVTTFNQHAVVSENRLTPIQNDYNLLLAPLFGCAITTGLGVVRNNAKLKLGDSILIYGAGGIGLNIVQGAAMTSAYPIIAVDIHDNKLKLAQKLGATHIINSNSVDVVEAITAILGKDGADVVVDNTGLPEIISKCYELTKSKGRTILVGVPRSNAATTIHTLPLHFGKVLTGSHGGECNPSEDIPKYINLNNAGILKLEELISKIYTLPQINDAIMDMQNGKIAGRCLVKLF